MLSRRPAPGDQRPGRRLVHDRRRLVRAGDRDRRVRLVRARAGREAAVRVDPVRQVMEDDGSLPEELVTGTGGGVGRGPAQGPRPPGARRARPPRGDFACGGGRGAGGADRRAADLAGAPAARPEGLAATVGGVAASSDAAPQRDRPAPARGGRGRDEPPTGPDRAGRRHAAAALPLLRPRAVARLGRGPHAARRRRADDPRDRRRVRGARGDDGAADQPGQADGAGHRRFDRPADLAVVLRVLTSSTRPVTADESTSRPRRSASPGSSRCASREPEVRGLLALMLLHHARHAARSSPRPAGPARRAGPRAAGTAPRSPRAWPCCRRPWPRTGAGAYQLQAAIAALHDDAATADETDWPQVLEWYDELLAVRPDRPRPR